jgi:hypothetical protein
MHRAMIIPLAVVVVVGVTALLALLIGVDLRIALPVAIVIGEAVGVVPGWWTARRARQWDRAITATLLAHLVDMGDTLQEVSIESLQRRGGWDRTLFENVLARVEKQTPGFQGALIDYLRRADAPRSGRVLAALLAVDRLSAAYTYWTRLFPPRKQNESMFVLSLLQDLSEKVESAIHLLEKERGRGTR